MSLLPNQNTAKYTQTGVVLEVFITTVWAVWGFSFLETRNLQQRDCPVVLSMPIKQTREAGLAHYTRAA